MEPAMALAGGWVIRESCTMPPKSIVGLAGDIEIAVTLGGLAGSSYIPKNIGSATSSIRGCGGFQYAY